MTERAKPTLLVLASTYPRWPDDPEPSFVHELCRRLATTFHVIALVPDAPDADPSGNFEGVEVVRYRYAPRRWQTLVNNGGIATNLQRSPWKWLLVPLFVGAQWIAARRLLRQQRVDVVHAHWLLPQGLIARDIALRHSVPYVVTSHGGDLFGLRGKLLTALKRKVAASSAAMSVVSTAMRTETLRMGLTPPTLAVLPMGVDLRVRFVPDKHVSRDPDTLLFVGRLVSKKGLRHLLDAMPTVIAQRRDVRLQIAGFGPEEPALRRQAQQLGIGTHVEFLGAMPQSTLPDLYRHASVFVAPFVRDASGNQEGLPVVLMEAIGCGCPVIVGDVDGVQDLLGDLHTVVSVDASDIARLAAAVIDALDHPEQARSQAGRMRTQAEASVDWKIVAARHAALIRHAMAAPPACAQQ